MSESAARRCPFTPWRLRVAAWLNKASVQLNVCAARLLCEGSPERIYMDAAIEKRKEIHARYNEAAYGQMLRRSAFMVSFSILVAGLLIAGAISGFPAINFALHHL